jgi:DNA-directed RNA polymerase specialized sigma24 family protein
VLRVTPNADLIAAFPLLGRDDTAQHLFAILLQFLRSEELRSRRSHLAFSVARKMRRSGFRWAVRESRLELPNNLGAAPSAADRTEPGADESPAGVFLAAFLDNCERRGWLAQEERLLLIRFKLEGVTSAELARQSGQSVGAIEQRIHRLLKRLRRIARTSGCGTPQQLDLFSR